MGPGHESKHGGEASAQGRHSFPAHVQEPHTAAARTASCGASYTPSPAQRQTIGSRRWDALWTVGGSEARRAIIIGMAPRKMEAYEMRIAQRRKAVLLCESVHVTTKLTASGRYVSLRLSFRLSRRSASKTSSQPSRQMSERMQ